MARHFRTFTALSLAAAVFAFSWRSGEALALQEPPHFQFSINELRTMPLDRDASYELPAEHCRLRHALDAMDIEGKDLPIFALAGASASQGAGAGVGIDNTWFAAMGRELNEDRVIMRNAAQGSTNSFWSALTMDSVIHDADILFWEFSINDRLGRATGHTEHSPQTMEMAMEIWIRRAMMLPRKPALVILYLWDSADAELVSSAQRSHWELLKKYTAQGMDILTIYPGGIFKKLEESHGWTTLSDEHHPSKESHEYLGHYVLKNMRAVKKEWAPTCDLTRHNTAVERVPLSPKLRKHPLMASMSSAQAVSEVPVTPRFRPDPKKPAFDLFTCPEKGPCLEAEAKFMELAKVNPSRTDRKLAWALPTCASGNNSVNDLHQKVTIKFLSNEICNKAKIVALKVGGGTQMPNNLWSDTEPLEIQVRGNSLGQLHVPYSNFDDGAGKWGNKIPHMFSQDFNVFLDVSKDKFIKKGRAGCEVSLCKKNPHATGLWGKAWGQGTIDWVTVFY